MRKCPDVPTGVKKPKGSVAREGHSPLRNLVEVTAACPELHPFPIPPQGSQLPAAPHYTEVISRVPSFVHNEYSSECTQFLESNLRNE